jgi:hypothetical protein
MKIDRQRNRKRTNNDLENTTEKIKNSFISILTSLAAFPNFIPLLSSSEYNLIMSEHKLTYC